MQISSGFTFLRAGDETAARPVYEDFCQQHGLPEREEDVHIYDTFMLNTELDLLEIRLMELYDVVDYFVIGDPTPPLPKSKCTVCS
jgi:hypothetical protein